MQREQTTIRLPAELKEQLMREAERRGDSLNGLVSAVLYEFIRQIQKSRH